ncbi:MAG TPA: SBBP repeat-containing protein [Candidatus Hydrogenedentes bacterium]|nr:SBBP repeat-containing protein [Candidatus Hydrogenedentota bacterium]
MRPLVWALIAMAATTFVARADNPNSLVWSTFLGGISEDINQDLVADVNGDIYVCGTTRSSDFPTTLGAYDRSYNGGTALEYGGDTWVTKIDGVTGQIEYSTFIGGPDDEEPDAIYVNAAGEVIILGLTASPNFPTTPGAYDRTHNGGKDIYLLKLSANGSSLVWSTFLGGSGNEEAWEKTRLGLDASGNVYITGLTESDDFPATPGAYDETHNGPLGAGNASRDVFVAKLSADGSSLVYATYIGGSDRDQGMSLHANAAGEVYLTGFTYSGDFPATAGAYDETFNGARDIFALKLNAAGSALVYSTFIGGSGTDWAWDMVVDPSGEAYVTGNTQSADYPTTPGAYQTTLTSSAAVVTQLTASGDDIVASTLLGGSAGNGSMIALSLDRDAGGNIWIAGETGTTNLPITSLALQSNYGGGTRDAFVAQFDSTLGSLKYCSYLGGTGREPEGHVAVDSVGHVLLAGRTMSSDFVTTVNAPDRLFEGDGIDTGESYVVKFMPGTIQVHYLALFEAEMEVLYDSISQDYQTADLDADGLPDLYQVGLVAYVLSVQTHPYSNLVHSAYADAIASLQAETNYDAQLQPFHHALAALMITSQDMADFWALQFTLSGVYTPFVITKTADEPFSGAGDLDGDGVTNAEEYQNNESVGGTIESFMSAAVNPNLDGKSVPALGAWGIVTCAAAMIAVYWRRRSNQRAG